MQDDACHHLAITFATSDLLKEMILKKQIVSMEPKKLSFSKTKLSESMHMGSWNIFFLGWVIKMPLVTCLCAFRLRTLAQKGCGRRNSVWHVPCKFPHILPVVTCPCAFRLHRLARPAFSLKKFRTKCLL